MIPTYRHVSAPEGSTRPWWHQACAQTLYWVAHLAAEDQAAAAFVHELVTFQSMPDDAGYEAPCGRSPHCYPDRCSWLAPCAPCAAGLDARPYATGGNEPKNITQRPWWNWYKH